MKKFFLLIAIFCMIFNSCKKGNIINIHGLYIETSPVPGRSKLNFIGFNRVIKSEPGSIWNDTFHYSFSPGKIILNPIWTNQNSPQQFDFKKIDENSFQIENLYPSIPEAPKSYMIYKK